MKSTANTAQPVLAQELLTPADVVALIPGLRPKLLAEWRYKKIGPPFYKVGRIILYRFDDLEKWFEGLEHGGDSDETN